MLDRKFIGYEWPPFEILVERGQVVQFAHSLGETDPVYLDRQAAVAAGYRDIPALPTFPIALSQSQLSTIYQMLDMLSVNPAGILHGNQEYIFHDIVCVGDTLTGTKRLTDLYDRKNGELNFIETVIEYRNEAGQTVCEDRCTLVSRAVKGGDS